MRAPGLLRVGGAGGAGAARVRRVLRRRLGLGPQPRPGREDVPIGDLVSPLRYDVLVRAGFLRFYAAHSDLYAADRSAFLLRARSQPYFTWFTRVALSRYKPRVLADPTRVDAAFHERVDASAALWEAFTRRGFDPRFPITLRVAGPGTVLPSGKPVRRDYYVGDGCHRLALLLASGERVLPADLHRVDPVPLPEVLDNTSLLLDIVPVGTPDYSAFLSRCYASREARSVAELVPLARESRPDRLEELLAVLRADGAPTDAVAAARAEGGR